MPTSVLGEPSPLAEVAAFDPPNFSVDRRYYLDAPADDISRNLFQILAERRSIREFSYLSLERLGIWLWCFAKLHTATKRGRGPDWRHGQMPSAGGCHCVHIVLVRGAGEVPEIAIYDPEAHALAGLLSEAKASEIHNNVSRIVPAGSGTIGLLAVDTQRIGSCYANWESLAWRDAGVLLGGASIAATALHLHFCALGISCSDEIRTVLPDERFMGVGGFIVGAPPYRP